MEEKSSWWGSEWGIKSWKSRKGGGPDMKHITGTSSHSCDPLYVASETKVHRSLPRNGFLEGRPKTYATSSYVGLFCFSKLLRKRIFLISDECTITIDFLF